MPARRLVLASTSRYRSELLQRLRLSFTVRAPGVDETARPGEAPRALALRLALAKADAVADLDRDAVVIGSDQVAELDGAAIGKPGDHARAVRSCVRCAAGPSSSTPPSPSPAWRAASGRRRWRR